MQQKTSRGIRLIMNIGICMLFIAVAFSNAIVKSSDIQVIQTKKDSNPLPSKISASPILSFFIHDWNWWSNKPNMYAIPSGDIGIGTTNPQDKLDVVGIIHSRLGGFKFPDNTTQTTAAFGDGHSLDANDGSPVDAVYVDNNGNVGIGTAQPISKLDVKGGNVSIDGFPVCMFVGSTSQSTDMVGVYSPWTDVPNVTVNFTFLNAKCIDLRAVGSAFCVGGANVYFRFVVDGIPYGDPYMGDCGVGGSQAAFSWTIERIIPLSSGNHIAKLQLQGGQISMFGSADGARMFVFAW